jgi:hypothetical protein
MVKFFALAVVGNEVVVGGYFTSAGGVRANQAARFNTQTNTWSVRSARAVATA